MTAPAPASPTAVRSILGLVYAAQLGYRPLRLDLHLPAETGPEPVPVVLHIHGGAWLRGRRELTSPPIDALAPFPRFVESGFAVATVDYRLSGEACFPAQLHDVKAAVSWLRGPGGAAHGLDGERIVAWGESAGGHLAALLGVTGHREDPVLSGPNVASGTTLPVSGVIDWYGPSDLLALAVIDTRPPTGGAWTATAPGTPPVGLEHDSPQSPEGMLLGGTVTERPQAARAASPTSYADASAPPFLIRHGAEDVVVPPSQSELLAQALRAAGASVDYALVPGSNHSWLGAPDPEGLLTEAIAFARACVG